MKELCYIDFEAKKIILEDGKIIGEDDIIGSRIYKDNLYAMFRNDKELYLILNVGNDAFMRYPMSALFKNTLEKEQWKTLEEVLNG